MSTVEVPGALISVGRLPSVCARHGIGARRRVRFVIKSRPDVGPVTEVLHPGKTALGRGVEYSRRVKLVPVDGWPLCEACVRVRLVSLVAAGVLFFGGIVALVAGFVAGSLWPLLGGLVGIFLAVVPFSWGSLPRLTGTEAAADGESVLVKDAHPTFATELQALITQP
ncbi:hypothetical protein F4553_004145 [Allocatelliglobosispora scoriae]|uniref:Uncharacterized protein n=1 Tax=Allocatelliglobosispora scoriae TaxID=643052 RepID=A0A841BTL6_9ACTN|nr:hypothetical protein [Allocatelliglobosispora scoriae]MBB5870766.1 hypothetical protein [Allocatelliglobosispora scoriae]